MKTRRRRHEHSAGLIIIDRNVDSDLAFKNLRILLVQKHNGRWELPKGKLESGEKPEEAARREAAEETGIKDLEILPGFHEIVRYTYRLNNEIRDKRVDFYLARALQSQLQLSPEHRAIQWFSPDEALEKVTYHDLKVLIRKALEFLKEKIGSTDNRD